MHEEMGSAKMIDEALRVCNSEEMQSKDVKRLFRKLQTTPQKSELALLLEELPYRGFPTSYVCLVLISNTCSQFVNFYVPSFYK
jgi:SOS response regulatory protein OraA/RecX